MSILDQETQERKYFPNSEADIFMEEFQQPKQEMNINEVPELETDKLEAEEKTQENTKMSKKAAKQAGKFVVGLIEAPTAMAGEFISGGDADKYRFSESEHETMTEAFANYLEEHSIDIPPGWILAIVVLTIVGGKIATAFKDRKENERFAEAEKRIKDLEARLAKQQIKVNDASEII